MKRLRVLQLMDLPMNVAGGLERTVRSLADELNRRGHDVSVVTGIGGGTPDTAVDGLRVHQIRGWSQSFPGMYEDLTRRQHPPLPDPGFVAQLRRILAAERPDVIHANGWSMYSALSLIRDARSPAIVVTLHDYGYVCAKKTFVRENATCNGPAILKCIRCSTEQYGVAKAIAISSGLRISKPLHRYIDVLVSVSNAVAQHSGVPTSMVIPSFVPDTIREELRLTARPPSLPDDDGYILFVGGLSSHKGLGTLLDAYSLMGTKVPLVLIGKRSADSPVQLPPGVNFVGEFAHADVMASYRHAGVVAMPSEWPEPFGLVAVEAMLAGAPLVASRVGGLADQVVDGVNGILVPPRSSHALAKALLAVLEDQRLRERLSVAARASAGQYTVSAICGQVEAVYERAIQIRRSRADVS